MVDVSIDVPSAVADLLLTAYLWLHEGQVGVSLRRHLYRAQGALPPPGKVISLPDDAPPEAAQQLQQQVTAVLAFSAEAYRSRAAKVVGAPVRFDTPVTFDTTGKKEKILFFSALRPSPLAMRGAMLLSLMPEAGVEIVPIDENEWQLRLWLPILPVLDLRTVPVTTALTACEVPAFWTDPSDEGRQQMAALIQTFRPVCVSENASA